VMRDIRLARETGCSVHIQHLSTAGATELVRAARAEGLPVSAELTPHHLALVDTDVRGTDANFKMNPPLRAESDRIALARAVGDGTIQAFATDHAPHTPGSKGRGFQTAPFGVVGLETAVGVTYTHSVKTGLMSESDWVRRWTSGPAAVIGMDPPSLRAGAPADIVILDLTREWRVQPAEFLSKSRNTPFAGQPLVGRAVCTLRQGRVLWFDPDALPELQIHFDTNYRI